MLSLTQEVESVYADRWLLDQALSNLIGNSHRYCPEGAVIEAEPGKTLCQSLLENDILIEHACEQSCACTTCHVIVREGFAALDPAEEDEEDLLDKAWGLEPNSRLSCQIIWSDALDGLTLTIPED